MPCIETLRDRIVGHTPSLCAERARIYTDSWKSTEGEPVSIRRALAFEAVLKNQTIFIQPGALTVGNQAGRPLAAPVFPEYELGWLEKEIGTLPERRLDRFSVDSRTLEALREIFPYWRGRTHFDRVKAQTLQFLHYHVLGRSKYHHLEEEYPMERHGLLPAGALERLSKAARAVNPNTSLDT